MRFTLEIPTEPPRHYPKRWQALAYIARRQQHGTLTAGATLTDNQTGTVMRVKPSENVTSCATQG